MTHKEILSSGTWQHKSPGRNDTLSGRRLCLRSMELSTSGWYQRLRRERMKTCSWREVMRMRLTVKVMASLSRQGFSLVLKMQIENTRRAQSYEMTHVTRVRETEANWACELLHWPGLGQENHFRLSSPERTGRGVRSWVTKSHTEQPCMGTARPQSLQCIWQLLLVFSTIVSPQSIHILSGFRMSWHNWQEEDGSGSNIPSVG